MAVSNFIQKVMDDARGRPRSTQWYKDKIKEFGKPGALDLIRDGKRATSPFFGRLNMFFYDPKFKKTLPYYDTFPLVLPLERYSDGFSSRDYYSCSIKRNSRIKGLKYILGMNQTIFDNIRLTDDSNYISSDKLSLEFGIFYNFNYNH